MKKIAMLVGNEGNRERRWPNERWSDSGKETTSLSVQQPKTVVDYRMGGRTYLQSHHKLEATWGHVTTTLEQDWTGLWYTPDGVQRLTFCTPPLLFLIWLCLVRTWRYRKANKTSSKGQSLPTSWLRIGFASLRWSPLCLYSVCVCACV